MSDYDYRGKRTVLTISGAGSIQFNQQVLLARMKSALGVDQYVVHPDQTGGRTGSGIMSGGKLSFGTPRKGKNTDFSIGGVRVK